MHYFLTGVARQAEDAMKRSERINELLGGWRDALSGAGSRVPLLIFDLVASNPFLTVRGAEAMLNVACSTVMRSIAKLQELGVLSQVTQAKRDRVFCASGILNILEEPPHLNPSERL